MKEKITAIATNCTPSRFGFEFLIGAMFAISLATIVIKGINYIIPDSWHGAYDTTDRPGERSGLGLHTDALTGCQYLTSKGSGITPRLDATGKHICGVQP